MAANNLNDFVPLNIELAERLGLVDAIVAGAIWLRWNIHKKVCNAGTREIGRMTGQNFTTVSKSIKRLIEAGLVEDLSPDRKGAPHDLIPSVDLINTLCKKGVDVVNTPEPSVDLINTGVDDINTSVDLINKEEVKNLEKNTTTTADQKNRVFALKILDVCNLNTVYLTDPAIKEWNELTLWLRETGATLADLDYFKDEYWWGKTPPVMAQVKKYWSACKAQQGGLNNGHTRGKRNLNAAQGRAARANKAPADQRSGSAIGQPKRTDDLGLLAGDHGWRPEQSANIQCYADALL